MKCYAFLLALMFIAPYPGYSQSMQHRREQPPTWYEKAAHQVNPGDNDFGSAWEQRKQDFINQLRNPYFRYGLAMTGAVVMLLVTQFALYVRYRRSLECAAQTIADIRRHDESARSAAREAIRRYNDHIELCNRVIEGDESGLWKWISGAELSAMKRKMQQLNDELTAAREEIKRLKEELETKTAAITEMSLRVKNTGRQGPQSPKPSASPAHIERINQLELELIDERKKNLHVKGTALDARNG
jgi:chromosome segregation ATPase